MSDLKQALLASDNPQPESPASKSFFSSSTFSPGYDAEAGQERPNRRPYLLRLLNCGTSAEEETKVAEEKEGITAIQTRSLESYPRGYPRLASFLSSECNFSLYRGFGYLHSRVLLGLQDDIVILERELEELDNEDALSADDRRRLENREFDVNRERNDILRSRQDILAEIQSKLIAYDELLIKARDIQTFQKPSERDYRNVRTWFWNIGPLVEEESEFIRRKEDIVTLRHGREWCSFDGIIESSLKRFDCNLIRRIFCTRELRDKTNDKNVHYYSASRVEGFVGLVISIIVFVLLVLPVVAMYQLTSIGTTPNSTFS